MLAVLLGASWYPKAPNLAAGRAFRNSATDLLAYLTEPSGLRIPDDDILWLFDDPRSSADQLEDVSSFLSRRVREKATLPNPAQAFFLYYVGHGLFTMAERAYCLAVRSTNESNVGSSSIRATDLATVIKENVRFLPRYLILDCCFAASVYGEFQSAPLSMARDQVLEKLPRRGTALLCSSNARDASLVAPDLAKTMFSGALIKALRDGDPTFGSHLSLSDLSDLADLVRRDLKRDYPESWVRPEVLSPDQREGDLSDVPLFPNRAYPGSTTPGPVEKRPLAGDIRRKAEEALRQETADAAARDSERPNLSASRTCEADVQVIPEPALERGSKSTKIKGLWKGIRFILLAMLSFASGWLAEISSGIVSFQFSYQTWFARIAYFVSGCVLACSTGVILRKSLGVPKRTNQLLLFLGWALGWMAAARFDFSDAFLSLAGSTSLLLVGLNSLRGVARTVFGGGHGVNS
jgi:uncharacterized caspase-like protein